MEESSEFIGSMPSTPQPEPQPAAPAQAARTGNPWNMVGLFVCGMCLLIFPTYAQLDDLAAGIFCGMGSLLLFFGFARMYQVLTMDARKNRSAQAVPARPGRISGGKKLRWINGVLFGVVLFLLGILLMLAPDMLSINDGGLVSIGLCIMGLAIIFLVALRYVSYKLTPIEKQGTGLETSTSSSVQGPKRAIRIDNHVSMLIMIVCELAFVRYFNLNLSAFYRGVCYGIGLLWLLLMIIALNSLLFRSSPEKKAGLV